MQDDTNNGLRKFLKMRDRINKTFFVVLMIAYTSFYFLVMPKDTPYTSMIFTSLGIPILIFPFYYRATTYIFKENWFYPFYLVVSTFFFMYGLTFLIRDYGDHAGMWEFYHTIACVVIGYAAAILVSIPFKIMHVFLFDPEEFYYDGIMLYKLEKVAYPEKFAKEKEKKREESKYDAMNETQLNVALNNAIKNDEFEEAEKIKKTLERKFR